MRMNLNMFRFTLPSLAQTAIVGGGILFALLIGGLLGLSAYLPAAGLFGLLFAGLLLYYPRLTVWVVLIGSLIISGMVELYLPSLQLIRWAFALLSIALGIISLLVILFSTRRDTAPATRDGWLRLCLAGLAVSLVTGSLAGQLPMSDMVVGLKNYLQVWGLLFALAALRYNAKDAGRLVGFLALLSLVQLPVVLHQFFFLVPLRNTLEAAQNNIVAVDVVAGTFGADMNGGGRSSNLALLVAIAIIFFLARWKNGQISLKKACLFSGIAFAPIIFNEAKLAIILIPIGIGLLFRQTIVKRPLSALLGSVLVCGLMGGLLFVYSLLPGEGGKSFSSFIDESLAYNIGTKGYGTAILNRSTVYSFWWKEHSRYADFKGALFGHGPGASNPTSSTQTRTLANRRYAGYAIGLSGLSTLLWEVGLFGTTCVTGIFICAFRLAGRLIHRWADTRHAATLQATQIGLPLFAISLMHNNYIAFDIGYQAILVLMLGYLLAMARLVPTEEN